MLRRAPLKEQLVCFQVDFLKQPVVDVAFLLCMDVVGAQVGGDAVVDGEQGGVLRGNEEFVQVGGGEGGAGGGDAAVEGVVLVVLCVCMRFKRHS